MTIYEANTENLNELKQEGFGIIDFYSETCNPCKSLAINLDEIDNELPFIKIIKINTTQYPNLGDQYGIMAVPTLLFIKEGEIVERVVGLLNTDQLKEKISQHYY